MAPYVHGSIVSRGPENCEYGRPDCIVVKGDSLSTAWVVSDGFTQWTFGVTSATPVRWLGGGVADTSALTVGQVVWVEMTHFEAVAAIETATFTISATAEVILVQGP